MEIDKELLRTFIANRSVLSKAELAKIEEEREKPDSFVNKWLNDFDRKLSATGNELDWEKFLLSEFVIVSDDNLILKFTSKDATSADNDDELLQEFSPRLLEIISNISNGEYAKAIRNGRAALANGDLANSASGGVTSIRLANVAIELGLPELAIGFLEPVLHDRQITNMWTLLRVLAIQYAENEQRPLAISYCRMAIREFRKRNRFSKMLDRFGLHARYHFSRFLRLPFYGDTKERVEWLFTLDIARMLFNLGELQESRVHADLALQKAIALYPRYHPSLALAYGDYADVIFEISLRDKTVVERQQELFELFQTGFKIMNKATEYADIRSAVLTHNFAAMNYWIGFITGREDVMKKSEEVVESALKLAKRSPKRQRQDYPSALERIEVSCEQIRKRADLQPARIRLIAA